MTVLKHDQYARDFLRPRAADGAVTRDLDDFSGSKIDFDGLAARAAVEAVPPDTASWFWAVVGVGATSLIIVFVVALTVNDPSNRRDPESKEPRRPRSTYSKAALPSAPRASTEERVAERVPPTESPSAARPPARSPAPSAPAHVHLADNGKWQPDFGYDWVDPNSPNLEVRWVPGMRHPHLSNVVASTVVGELAPAPGYAFKSKSNVNLGVVPIRTVPTEEEQSAAVAKILVALFAQGMLSSEPYPEDGDDEFSLDELAREFARQIRHGAIRGALADLFPAATTTALDAAANFIVLAADGRLSSTELLAATARDAVTYRLRAVDPDLADAELIAEFLLRVARECESR